MKQECKSKIELKPCPCCGAMVKMYIDIYGKDYTIMGRYYIQCTKCGVSTDSSYRNCIHETEENLAAIWNRRVSV